MSTLKKKKLFNKPVISIIVILILSGSAYFGVDIPNLQIGNSNDVSVAQAFKNKQSKVWVKTSGQVTKILSDDNDGSRHQRFIVRLLNGINVLVAHNIDLAKRVPITIEDNITLSGRYEWNVKGGVIHWTHRDTKGKIPGGWIKHKSITYR